MAITLYYRNTTGHVGTLGTTGNFDLETTTGTTATQSMGANTPRTYVYYSATTFPDKADWETGDYTWYLDVTTANANVQLTTVKVSRYNSALNSELASGSASPNLTLNTTGLKSGTVSFASPNPGGRSSTDRLVITLTFTKLAGGGVQSISADVNGSSDSRIDTPLVIPTIRNISEGSVSVSEALATQEVYTRPISESSISASDSIEGTKIPAAPENQLYDVHFVEFPEEISDSLYVPAPTAIEQVIKYAVHVYNILGKVTTTKTHKYNLIGKITQTRTHKYNIITELETTKTHKYNIITKISTTKTHKYNIIEKITKTKTHKYQLEGKVSTTKTHKFNIISKLSTTKTHKFNILNKITTTKTHKYNIIGKVTVSKTHRFNIEQKIVTTKTHKYNIIGKLVVTKTHKFNVIGKLVVSKTHVFNVLASIARSATHKYDILERVTRTRTHKYDISSSIIQVTTTKTHKYNIISTTEQVVTTKTHLYNVIQRVTGLKTHVFSVLSPVVKAKTHKFNILGKVTLSRTHKFNIIGRVTLTKQHRFAILNKVTLTKSHKFNIVTKVTLSKTHKYNITGKVVVTKTHKYNMGGKVSTLKTHKYHITGKMVDFYELGGSTHALIKLPERIRIVDIISDIRNRAVANILITPYLENVAVANVAIEKYTHLLTAETQGHKHRIQLTSGLILPPIIDTIQNTAHCLIGKEQIEPQEKSLNHIIGHLSLQISKNQYSFVLLGQTQLAEKLEEVIRVASNTEVAASKHKHRSQSHVMIPYNVSRNKAKTHGEELVDPVYIKRVKTLIKIIKSDALFGRG
jgi:hypothetical protein